MKQLWVCQSRHEGNTPMKDGYVSSVEQALGAAIGESAVEQRIAAAIGRPAHSRSAADLDVVRLDGTKVVLEYREDHDHE